MTDSAQHFLYEVLVVNCGESSTNGGAHERELKLGRNKRSFLFDAVFLYRPSDFRKSLPVLKTVLMVLMDSFAGVD